MTGTVALLSLEPWDETWRRNQYLCRSLLEAGDIQQVVFVAPPLRRGAPPPYEPQPGVRVVTPTLRIPRRAGGGRLVAWELRRQLSRADLLWINDPVLGRLCLGRSGQPALYDVTDDWRSYPFPARIRRRLVSAEDLLAERAVTVVCSDALALRWAERYDRRPPVVHNGVDVVRYREAMPVTLPGPGPHVGYVGTLQSERLDIPLVLDLARSGVAGTVHLVGPDALDAQSRAELVAEPSVTLHPPRRAYEVAGVMKGMDVLLCPHRVDDFTLSLDAIKAYEYTAVGRPVVATPTSGFQNLRVTGVTVAPRSTYVAAVAAALSSPAPSEPVPGSDWSARAAGFAGHLRAAAEQRA